MIILQALFLMVQYCIKRKFKLDAGQLSWTHFTRLSALIPVVSVTKPISIV